ncbi:MAG: hypothetical protein NVSMB47_01670 [Polyangiales bacterium]
MAMPEPAGAGVALPLDAAVVADVPADGAPFAADADGAAADAEADVAAAGLGLPPAPCAAAASGERRITPTRIFGVQRSKARRRGRWDDGDGDVRNMIEAPFRWPPAASAGPSRSDERSVYGFGKNTPEGTRP